MLRLLLFLLGSAFLLGCPTDDDDTAVVDDDDSTDDDDDATLPPTIEVTVLATLDGEPTAGISVFQGGQESRFETDAAGLATFEPRACVSSPLNADHVLSGFALLPDRVARVSAAPRGTAASHHTRPQLAANFASITFERNVPWPAA